LKINVIGNECYLLLQKALLKIKTLKMSIIKDKNIEDEYNEDKNIEN
jgi:nucleoside diphosphate kinase